MVFFEIVILEGIRQRVPPATMHSVETAMVARAKGIMPWVVGLLFLSGIFLAYHHFRAVASPFASSFHTLLAIKIVLAFSVLAHFISAIRASMTGCMDTRRFKLIHYSIAVHMVLIVILAKLMFVVRW